jgi:hypothetical protein
MVNTYHKTGRKEYVDGRLRVVYQKDKSSKQYIKRGDRYVDLRTSAMKKGGNGPMKVTKDNIEAAIIVYAKQGQSQKFYAFNNNNMQKLNKSEELFENYIAPNGSMDTTENKLEFTNYPIDAIGYTLKKTGMLNKKTNVLEKNKGYNDKIKQGFYDLDALIYCLDVSHATHAITVDTTTLSTAADTAKTEADTAKTEADTADTAKTEADSATVASPATPVSKKYMVITFIIGKELCENLFDTDGSNPKSGQEDFLKSGNSSLSTNNANTEKPKTTIKDALEYINQNGTVTGTKLYEYGRNFYDNIINNSP